MCATRKTLISKSLPMLWSTDPVNPNDGKASVGAKKADQKPDHKPSTKKASACLKH